MPAIVCNTAKQMTGLEGETTERQTLVGQALDIAQHMATAYRQAPEHIRRMLNQVLFDKVYITPDDETGLLTAIVRYQPPFDGVLGGAAWASGSENQAVCSVRIKAVWETWLVKLHSTETTMSHPADNVTSSSRHQKSQACTVCQMMTFLPQNPAKTSKKPRHGASMTWV